MEAPLAHYFMYTGHNSYLTGNQVTSDCSTEPIIRALRRGVRVIELDLWPSTTKQDEVDVRHGGYELSISFRIFVPYDMVLIWMTPGCERIGGGMYLYATFPLQLDTKV